MPVDPKFQAITQQFRPRFLAAIAHACPRVIHSLQSQADEQAQATGPAHIVRERKEIAEELRRSLPKWRTEIEQACQGGAATGLISAVKPSDLPRPGGFTAAKLSLVTDDVIEDEIVSSRLGLAMQDQCGWEYADFRARVLLAERIPELHPQDVLRPNVLAVMFVTTWRKAGLDLEMWKRFQKLLHTRLTDLVVETYHEANEWLLQNGLMPEVDLRPLIRRTVDSGASSGGASGGSAGGQTGAAASGMNSPAGAGAGVMGGASHAGAHGAAGVFASQGAYFGGVARGPVGASAGAPSGGSRQTAQGAGRGAAQPLEVDIPLASLLGVLPTGASAGGAVLGGGSAGLPVAAMAVPVVVGQLQQLLVKQVPEFASTVQTVGGRRPVSRSFAQAMAQQARAPHEGTVAEDESPSSVLGALRERTRQLKKAAETPVERATVEVVALMFQNILTEESLPANIRILFARLQMPVLRVALAEPDFFATIDHPARRLIDRMGACVLGFDGRTQGHLESIEKEIRRVVQVVEAYPDTGRRVFQTVLTEFEAFIKHFFQKENAASSKGVSLAQQLEQRETLAIQFTIELRKMLDQVPVVDTIRDFLFKVWADVLAMTAVRHGKESAELQARQKVAAELIWSASGKVSREERAQVIQRLPNILKAVRDGMQSAGMPAADMDRHIQEINGVLAAAFSARTPAIAPDRLAELMGRLESVEDMLPDTADLEIDAVMVGDLSGYESEDLEVVAEGGTTATSAMMAWARELQVGHWFRIDYRGREEVAQLAWQGNKKQLNLFVTPQGRCILFQLPRLAAFLQGGLLVPVQGESLTVRATRDALVKLSADPERLLS